MIVKCVVACMTTDGADFYFCKVRCSEQDYDNGEHYEIAEAAAENKGNDRPMVTYDENDGPDWLFDPFDWDSASFVSAEDVFDEDDEDEDEEEEEDKEYDDADDE